MDLVSVVITTYKREPQLVIRAVQSVLHQTYGNIQLIVVDDSPAQYEYREQICEAIKMLDEHILYIQHAQNRGACVARNTGISAAEGKYIAFLDDDDEWLPEKIEKQMSLFNDEDVALVYCGSFRLDESSGERTIPEMKFIRGYVFDELIMQNYIGSTSFPLIRKSCLDQVGGFDPEMRSAEDYDLWLRLAREYKIDYVEDPLVVYHAHTGERISENNESRISGQEMLIKKYFDYLKKNRRANWIRHIKLSAEYARDQHLGTALKAWICAAAMCPALVRENLSYLRRLFSWYLMHRRLNHKNGIS